MKLFIILAIVSLVVAQDHETGEEVQEKDLKEEYLLILANRILTANLPENLQPEGERVLQDAAEGLQQCQEQLEIHHFIGLYRRCAAWQLKIGHQRISALENMASSTTAASIQ